MLALCWLWCGSAASAQLTENLTLAISPESPTSADPLVATLTGVAACPRVLSNFVGEGFVEIWYSGRCNILPPSPAPFLLHELLAPLSPGIWDINLVDLDVIVDPPPAAATVQVTVTDPDYSVELSPSPATEADQVVAHLTGIGSCPFPLVSEIGPDRIVITVGEGGICDPPPLPGPVEFDLLIGELAAGDYLVELIWDEVRVAENSLVVHPGSLCVPGANTLCLNGGRFRVEATWTTVGGLDGPAHAVTETGDTGLFWFFSPDNIEMVVKVLDGCATEFESFWVFAGGLTDVGVTFEVTDTETGDSVHYENPVGQRFMTITDTGAFATCP